MATAPERASEYHNLQDGCLTSTLARQLIMRTPAHAKAMLDGELRFDSDAMTVGTAVHQMLLRDDRIAISPFDEYRTNEAKEWRAATVATGLVPIKRKAYDEAREIAQHVNGQILEDGVKPTPFTQGTAEHVIRWDANENVGCRSLLDWLRDDRLCIDDLKTTGDASPQKFRRHVFNMGYDIQAAFYTRAVMCAYGVEPTFRFVVVETKPPYPVVIYRLSARAMASAQVKVDEAISLWEWCQQTGEWPAYTRELVEVDIPGWASDEADAWGEVDDSVPF